MARRALVQDAFGLPGRLADCISKDFVACEIFLVAGREASGTAKEARDRMTQAILCLRGRLLNVEKCRLDRALDNSQIQALIASLGAGISIQTMSVGEEDLAAGQDGSTFDIARLRYHKIIIATEPDERGERMRTSLLAFFYSYMKPLVLNGYVYLAQLPPVVTQLRSCDAEQMETVLLRPDTRRLVQVTEEAALEAVARARKQVQKARANRP